MLFRTDLALERTQMLGAQHIEGVNVREYELYDTRISEIKVNDRKGEEAIGKKQGTYITVEVPPFTKSSELTDGRLNALVYILRSLLPKEGTVLVAGLGNADITADALGPSVAQMVLATRHISDQLRKSAGLEGLRSVAVLTPGVMGSTGIEAAEIITAVAQKIKPSVILSVDALAAKSVDRLARTVQLCDSGIYPGSGVGNHRKEISRQTTGFPVISVGVPTVVDALSLARDLTGDENLQAHPEIADMMLAPREADMVTDSASKLLALAVNCALQESLTAEELLSLM